VGCGAGTYGVSKHSAARDKYCAAFAGNHRLNPPTPSTLAARSGVPGHRASQIAVNGYPSMSSRKTRLRTAATWLICALIMATKSTSPPTRFAAKFWHYQRRQAAQSATGAVMPSTDLLAKIVFDKTQLENFF